MQPWGHRLKHVYIYLCICDLCRMHVIHLITIMSICLFVYLSICLSVYLSIMYLSVYLSVCPSIYAYACTRGEREREREINR